MPGWIMNQTPEESRSKKSLKKNKTFGRYKIIEEIGSGGMGSVYKAYDHKLDRYVAIKIFHDQILREKEVMLLAKFSYNDGVVIIYDIGLEPQPFYVMELLQSSLKDKIQEQEMDLFDIVGIFKQIADILSKVHKKGIIHADIKPSNILLDYQNNPKIADFGISQIKKSTNSSCGTPSYMSPEQKKGEISTQSDIYSFGVTLYEAMNKKLPSRKLEYPTMVPKDLIKICNKCLENCSNNRYSDATYVAQDLQMLINKVITKPVPKNLLSNPPAISGFKYLSIIKGYHEQTENLLLEYKHNTTKMKFVLLPGGTFRLGSVDSERGRNDNEILRMVSIKPFLISKYLVTQKVWKQVIGDNPSEFKGEERPVENVSMEDCKKFCGLMGLQLPNQDEWEYACRSGTNTSYYWGNQWDRTQINSASFWAGLDIMDFQQWKKFDFWSKYKSIGATTTPVGHFPPNAFTLYDMLGNVFELCEDYNIRGGAWSSTASGCRAAFIASIGSGEKDGIIGFRPIRRTPEISHNDG